MSIVALIPARGGSKGIPRKNLAQLAGRPLIAHSIEQAKASATISGVFVSTDSSDIAEFCRQHGGAEPLIRPPALAQDDTPMLPVLQHFLEHLAASAGGIPEAVVLLQATSPLRTPQTIDRCVELFSRERADSVVSVVKVPHSFAPVSLLQRDDDGRVRAAFPEQGEILRRQDKPTYYSRSGPAVLVLSPAMIRAGRLYSDRTFSVVIDPMESWDVDNPLDLAVAEAWLNRLAP